MVILAVAAIYLVSQFGGIDRQNYRQVADAFAGSFVDNDIETAKSLAIPSQWGRIDAWMATHPPFSCPFSWDLESETTFGVGLRLTASPITATYSYNYQCYEKDYILSIDDIVLEQTENGWVVVEWSQVCESYDWESTWKCE